MAFSKFPCTGTEISFLRTFPGKGSRAPVRVRIGPPAHQKRPRKPRAGAKPLHGAPKAPAKASCGCETAPRRTETAREAPCGCETAPGAPKAPAKASCGCETAPRRTKSCRESPNRCASGPRRTDLTFNAGPSLEEIGTAMCPGVPWEADWFPICCAGQHL